MVLQMHFWSNYGCWDTIADLAPQLFRIIPKRRVNKRTVMDDPSNRSWIFDIQEALSVEVISEYLILWDLIDSVQLRP
jgi:hypothetical protein